MDYEQIAKGDAIEALFVRGNDGKFGGYTINQLEHLSNRGELVVKLCQAWGLAALMGDVIASSCDDPAHNHTPMKPHEFVLKCADVVDAIYDECQRRGWAVKLPALRDVEEQ